MDDEQEGPERGPEADGPGDFDAREAARIRRRDRDAEARARDLMRPGMGKVFKQIQDAQARAAREPVAKTKVRKRRPRA